MNNLADLPGNVLVATLISGFILTWIIGLFLPIMIRFVFLKRPLSKWPAIGTAFLCHITNFFIFTRVFNSPAEQIQTPMVLILVISIFILKKPKKKSLQKEKQQEEPRQDQNN